MKPNSVDPLDSHSLSSLQKPFSISKLVFSLLFFLSLLFNLYFLCLSTSSSLLSFPFLKPLISQPEPAPPEEKTGLRHVVFGIGSAKRHWAWRKQYIRLWWRPNSTRGFIWLDQPINLIEPDDLAQYPELRVSGDTTRFPYSNNKGNRTALRMTRIVSEMVRLGLEGVRWFVMADDDTVFYPDNLVRVLSKYDHTRMYYIGSNSECHLTNMGFSFGMAYGGGGIAISYPLAKAIEKMQDRCIQRYPDLFGLDDRIYACLSELGVPLTKEPGFHQFDVQGDLFGLLAAHPVSPLVTLHHLDRFKPIFPLTSHLKALERLSLAAKVDSAALMQQSICYDKGRNWTVSVSWGYAVQIIRGSIRALEMQRPVRTFVNSNWSDGPTWFDIDTRPVNWDPCEDPFVYFMGNVEVNVTTNVSRSEYIVHRVDHPWCWWKMESPEKIRRVEVYKIPTPHKWDEAPRRDCCRVLPTEKEDTMVIDVGECNEGEVIEA